MRTVLLIVFLQLSLLAQYAVAQWKEPPSTGSPTYRLPDRTIWAGQSGLGPVLTAKLVDKDRNAKQHRAIVEVDVDGVRLVYPEKEPNLEEAHIQYRLDNEPPRDSASKSCAFEQLAPGEHRIRVTLASSDGRRIGKGTTLKVTVP